VAETNNVVAESDDLVRPRRTVEDDGSADIFRLFYSATGFVRIQGDHSERSTVEAEHNDRWHAEPKDKYVVAGFREPREDVSLRFVFARTDAHSRATNAATHAHFPDPMLLALFRAQATWLATGNPAALRRELIAILAALG